MTTIDSIRQSIDSVDQQIVMLLNQRHTYALEIGRIKVAEGLPVCHPEREGQIMDGLAEHNAGPLSTEALQAIFELIIEKSKENVSQQSMDKMNQTDTI